MEGCFTFQWGGRGVGVAFQMGRGFTFKWEVCPMGGIGFDGGRLKKSQDGGGTTPMPSPLWETLPPLLVFHEPLKVGFVNPQNINSFYP